MCYENFQFLKNNFFIVLNFHLSMILHGILMKSMIFEGLAFDGLFWPSLAFLAFVALDEFFKQKLAFADKN